MPLPPINGAEPSTATSAVGLVLVFVLLAVRIARLLEGLMHRTDEQVARLGWRRTDQR